MLSVGYMSGNSFLGWGEKSGLANGFLSNWLILYSLAL